MKRLAALLVSATLVMSWGCGMKSYEIRLEKTLEAMRYSRDLDENLTPAPTDKRFREFPMYIRAPKDMPLSANFVMAADVPVGRYDLTASFVGQSKDSPGTRALHVIGRRKAPPKKQAKKDAPAQPDAPRGPFEGDVFALVGSVYGANDALANPKPQNEKKRNNPYRRIIFSASNGNVVRIYLYKKENYEVALVWDVPGTVDKNANYMKARDLCLQSFAVGKLAEQYFSGNASAGEAEGEAAPAPF